MTIFSYITLNLIKNAILHWIEKFHLNSAIVFPMGSLNLYKHII